MSTTRTYKVNLRGIDTSQFKNNPVVLSGFSYQLDAVIGKARILKGKRDVVVEYVDSQPQYAHAIGTATLQRNNGKTELMALAAIPEIRL